MRFTSLPISGVSFSAQTVATAVVYVYCAIIFTPAAISCLAALPSDWSKYYTYAVNKVLNGKEIAADWTAGYAEDAVVISQLNDEHVTDGTAAKAAELEKNLRAGNALMQLVVFAVLS